MLKAFFGTQIGGKACKTLKRLPIAMYERFPRDSKTLATLCVELDLALAAFDQNECERVVLTLSRQLCENGGPSHESCRQDFVSFGGDALLLQVLFCAFETRGDDGGLTSSSVTRTANLKKQCLDILRELCCTVPFFTESLAGHRDYLVESFLLMANAAIFHSAVNLVEEILTVRDDVLDLRGIHNFSNLVNNFSSKQLMLFCDILAMVVFEPQMTPKGLSGNVPSYADNESTWSAAEFNHQIILSIPGILSRLLQLLYHHKSSRASASAATGFSFARDFILFSAVSNSVEEDTNRGMLLNPHRLNARTGELELDTRNVDTNSVPTEVDISALTGRTHPAVFDPLNQVEILFVLCTLCGSKQRSQVQDRLAELGLVEILYNMFEKLDWSSSSELAKTGGIHGLGCLCNPKLALKVQYLRLIHNFCDRDSCNKTNKNLLLKPYNVLDKDINWPRDHPRASDGLIMKIVKVLTNEPTDSMFRFWLASCVEAFLRGSDVNHQAIVASSGLMEHLLAEILKGGFSCPSSLQMNFDLLGELIKFNPILFGRLSRLLRGSKFDDFVEVLVTNIVDSNVFIRSVLLSLDKFRNGRHGSGEDCGNLGNKQAFTSGVEPQVRNSIVFLQDSQQEWHQGWCHIGTFIIHNEVKLLRNLMCCVAPGEINQDNICVLNTALILFILAERNGILQIYLESFRTGESSEGRNDLHILQNFRKLLSFWKTYYLPKTSRDSLSLQYSTNIAFEEWQRVVDLICRESERIESLPPISEDSERMESLSRLIQKVPAHIAEAT